MASSASNQTSLYDLLYYAFQIEFDYIISAIVRTAVVTFFVLFIIRWLNKKGLGQLTVFELLIVVGLGSAIGDPMIYVEHPGVMPIPRSLVAVLVVVALFKLLDHLTIKSKKFSKITLADPTLIVKDGKFVEKGLHNARLDQKEYHSYMRINGIEDISEIKLSYFEVNGQCHLLRKRSSREKR